MRRSDSSSTHGKVQGSGLAEIRAGGSTVIKARVASSNSLDGLSEPSLVGTR